ncbi:MAG: 4Fe-4S binding protein [Firmicutes bacterium]|jgi:ferredoxin|nr:4Fe-4S binding protein [Bacillota bacterium]
MSDKILKKDKWSEFVEKMASSRKVWLVDSEDAVKFVPYAEGEAQPTLAPPFEGAKRHNTTVPPKSVVFPQTETMFSFELGQQEVTVPEGVQEMVVLGIRPCDARAMSIVDSLFSWDYDDGYYQDKRNQTLLIGLACNEPCVNCFCTSVGGGPASTEGLDVLMVDLGDRYLLREISEKGKEILGSNGDLLSDATAEDRSAADALTRAAEEKIGRSIEIEGIAEGLPELWEDQLWKDISNACISCGTCTFLCPTCHCFDIQDEVEMEEGRRCRMWDSCMFAEYTLHTSGHNPRPTTRERTRNRINHKYYYYVSKFGKTACVGCGRCIEYCPANIDILDILSKVKEAL